MPELPEVETIVRQLRPRLKGRRVRRLEILDPKLQNLRTEAIAGRRVAGIRRLSKQIVLVLPGATSDPDGLSFHLRMTGRLLWSEQARRSLSLPIRAQVVLDRGALLFEDVRRFGTIRMAPLSELEKGVGLDPLGAIFTARMLAACINGSRQPIKIWLMRQDRLAGVGNIYASESLFVARIHPGRPAGSLSTEEVRRLHRSLRRVLRHAIQCGGTTFSDYRDSRGSGGTYQRELQVYGRESAPCPRCGQPIRRIVQCQRSTFFCHHCQPPRNR